MTTIACDGLKLVSDSKVTTENKSIADKTYSATKIWVLKNGDLMGAAGANEDIEKFQAWYGSKKKKPHLSGDFEAIVLTTKGRMIVYDETLARDILNDPFYAIGSGGPAALGALHMGSTVEQAVEIATKIDPHSGLPIQTLTIVN